MSSTLADTQVEIMAHEAEIMLPGSFVVLQGTMGDGMANTIDTAPVVPVVVPVMSPEASQETDSEEEFMHVQAHESQQESSHGEEQASGRQRTVLGDSGSLVSQSVMAPATPPSMATVLHRNLLGLPDESFIVVSDDSNTSNQIPQRQLTPTEQEAIYSWQTQRRQDELRHRHDWLISLDEYSTEKKEEQEQEEWWHEEGRLVVLGQVPQRHGVSVERTVLTTLSPGSTVVGTKLVCLDSRTLSLVRTRRHPRDGLLQLLQLESPLHGYIVLSRNGHLFVAPGLPSLYTDPQVWIWRVTCAAGAYVRQGLELNTKHVATIPYGMLLRVTRKTINSEGLVRLRIHCKEGVEGWISEFLNPKSGQRGPIAQPVPFPVPCLYRVKLPEGAILRSGLELSSLEIGNAPVGAVLNVVGRAFSEHPEDQCIERLKLAGNGGWVSVRLNKPRPDDELVVEQVGIDGTFDPDAPGLFHLDAQKRVLEQVAASEASPEQAEMAVDEDDGLRLIPSTHPQRCSVVSRSGLVPPETRANAKRRAEEKCLVCLTEERNSTIVHGETGHIACCLMCARILRARGDRCPVCRLPIDSVIQQFWA